MRRLKFKMLEKLNIKKMHSFLFLLISFIYSEFIVRIFTYRAFFTLGLVNIILFSAAAAGAVSFLASFFKGRVNLIIIRCFTAVCFVVSAVQTVYHLFFGKYLILYSLAAGGTEQVITDGLFSSTLSAVIAGLPAILLLLLPVLIAFPFAKHFINCAPKGTVFKVLSPILSALFYALAIGFIMLVPDMRILYNGVFDPNLTVGNFGLFQTEILDITYNVLGFEQNTDLEQTTPSEPTSTENDDGDTDESLEPTYDPQILDIDFNTLIANEPDEDIKKLHEYFSLETPSYTNEYTGMFEGYNLIMITAEGFSPYAVNKDITPTLYKMANSGFNFTNFYTPIWGVSTSDGEYVNCTGLIPKSGVWSFYRSGTNKMPFCLGNQFNKIGVTNTHAFHNHTYSFYHRNISHPNMGYTYMGYGNGLEKYITKQWPESDLEMIEATTDMYLSSGEPFHTYYMTVSGHLEYTYSGNSMVAKNWDKVKDLTCSDIVKGYYACHIELDKAMEELLLRLEAAGVADKTVIVITPDHYPYGLEDNNDEDKYRYFNELAGREIETNFELYKSIAIIYCPSMEKAITVDKYSSSLDLLPTISNLFGLEFDSRLIMGRDILSSSDQLVIFSNRSWISEKGKYNAETKEFEAFIGEEFNTQEQQYEYITNMNKIVSNKFKVSAMMLENDYYSYAFPE